MSGFINCQLKQNQVYAPILNHLSLQTFKKEKNVCCVQPFDDGKPPPKNQISPTGGKVLRGNEDRLTICLSEGETAPSYLCFSVIR